MKTRIIVDSTADLVPEIKARVYTVPLTVHFGQEEYIDGVTIDHRTFYEKLIESDVMPTTSQATPNDFIEELEKATAGSLRKAVQDGNYEEGTFMSGQIAGMLRELRPCEDILRSMTAEAEELLKNAYKRFE